MNIRIEVGGVNAGGGEERRQVLAIERQELAMETLGMNLSESKTLLANVQDFVIAQQTNEYLEQQRRVLNAADGTRAKILQVRR